VLHLVAASDPAATGVHFQFLGSSYRVGNIKFRCRPNYPQRAHHTHTCTRHPPFYTMYTQRKRSASQEESVWTSNRGNPKMQRGIGKGALTVGTSEVVRDVRKKLTSSRKAGRNQKGWTQKRHIKKRRPENLPPNRSARHLQPPQIKTQVTIKPTAFTRYFI